MHYNTLQKRSDRKVTKIALIDDHGLFREGLTKVIDGFSGYKVTLKAGNGKELISQLDPANVPDIILLDLNMPVMDGYHTALWLRENYPDAKVVILTMFNSELAIIRLLRLGVKSFIKKDIHPDELKSGLKAIRTVGHYSSAPISEQLDMVSFSCIKRSRKPVKLTNNEAIFLKWATTDLTYKEIAKKMCVSDRTVENYCESLKDKFSIKSRIGLAMYAVKNGMADI